MIVLVAVLELLGSGHPPNRERIGQELDGALVNIQPFMAEHAPFIGSRVIRVPRSLENEDGDEDDHEDEDGGTELGTP